MINKELMQIFEKYNDDTEVFFYHSTIGHTYLSVGYSSHFDPSYKIISLHKHRDTSTFVVLSPEPNEKHADKTAAQIIEQLNQYDENWEVLAPDMLENKYNPIAFISSTLHNESLVIASK